MAVRLPRLYHGHAIRMLVRLCATLSVLSLLGICLVTLFSVSVRLYGGRSGLWTEEVSILLMKIMVFGGAAAMYGERSYIAVDTLAAKFPGVIRYLLVLFGWFLVATFAGVVLVEAVKLYPTQMRIRTYLLELPRFYYIIPLIVSMCVVLLVSLHYIVFLLRGRYDSRETWADVAISRRIRGEDRE